MIPGHGRIEDDHFLATVAVEIEQLQPARGSQRWPCGQTPGRGELPLAEILLIKEGARLLDEHPWQPFAVEVDPLMGGSLDAAAQIGKALPIDHLDRGLDLRSRISKLDRRVRLL